MTTTGKDLTMEEKLSILKDRYGDYPDITYSEDGPDGKQMIPESTSDILHGNGSDFPDNIWVDHWWHRNVFISLLAGEADGRRSLVVTNDGRGLEPGYDAYARNLSDESEQHLGCYASVRMAMHVLERAHPEFHYINT